VINDAPPAPTPGKWETATVVEIRRETKNAKTFRLALPAPVEYLAGQHFLVRLTAANGYRATRSYSVASAPDGSNAIELTIERLEKGEVSVFLHDVLAVGDTFDVRGPVGGWFVWRGDSPVLLVGGGSGVVPLMAMLRLARSRGRSDLARLLVSVRSPDDLYYTDEIAGAETTVVFTRAALEASPRPVGRLALSDVAPLVRPDTSAYVCGSAGFADAATALLIEAGQPASTIRVERFGMSG